MTIQRKKVLILYCGSVEEVTESNLPQWLQRMPELDIIADIDSVYVSSKLQNNISPGYWQNVAENIKKNQKEYSGFVIIHPVETLLYTASAVSFLLNDLNKPIIFTGSQKQDTEKKSQLSVKANLINSVQVATFILPEVCVMFGNKLIRANQAHRVYSYSLNVFESPDSAVLGKIDFSIRIFEKNLKKVHVVSRFESKLNNNVEYVKIQPVFNIKEMSQRFVGKAGVFVEGQGHSVPQDLESLFSKLATKTPVVLFDAKTSGAEKNIIYIDNMTLESALVKFMYVIAQTKDLDEIKKLMQMSLAGEVIY
ncbi:asparaginase [Patescibacteria group bacterium]|nr:asparaginase [Patescibacteria group bacterium]